MNIAFPNQTVLVTGVARGIGRGIAEAFASRGAAVHAADIRADELAAQVATIKPADGGSVTPCPLDVTDAEAVAAAVARIGRVDVVVHAAGGVLGQSKRPFEEVSPADWQKILDVNVNGAFNLTHAALPGMKAAGRGRIVIISSRAGLGVSLTGIHAYGTAKAAQIGFVRQISNEVGQFGVTVNSVAPGFMRTSPDYERQWQSYGAEGQRQMVERIAMRRLGQPSDIAHAVLFLASDYAEWITGQTLCVTGGP